MTAPDLNAVWHTLPWAVLDFETTGADPATCMPVEVAVVRFEQGEPVERFESLVDPGCPIPPEALAIHGITDEHVRGQPRFGELVKHIRQVSAGAVPCAYNAGFDRVILYRLLEAEGMEVGGPDEGWLDPLVVVRDLDRFERGPGRHKLENACKRWGVEVEETHRAMGDALDTGRLLWALRERIGDLPLGTFLRRLKARAEAQEREYQAWQARQRRQEPVDA
jgi:DNA polymerase III subunit epsilon